MNTSAQGIDLILAEEGFSPKPYFDDKRDTARIEYSIGYGHQIKPDEEHLLTAKISREKGREIFEKDLKHFEKIVKGWLKKNLNQNEFDAIVTFAYNTPKGALEVIKLINAGRPESEVLAKWRKYVYWKAQDAKKPWPALVKRREKEIALFKKKEETQPDGLSA